MQRAMSAAPVDAANDGCKAAAQDLAPAGDQGKQDEVFIGGLPSHWKAQQVCSVRTLCAHSAS